MKKIIPLLIVLSFPVLCYAQNEVPKEKKISITINSNFYSNASQVIVGVLKQAKIANFYIDEKLEKQKTLNFQFKDKTLDDALSLLSKIYNVKIETTEKKDFYTIIVR